MTASGQKIGITEAPESTDELALVVDLDGTLLSTDTLHELVAANLRRPLRLACAPLLLLRGRAHLKAWLAEGGALDVEMLPVREAVLERVRAARSVGRQTILATGADQRLAEGIAERLGVFDVVVGSADGVNRTGHAKLEAIREIVGTRAYEYLGDSAADLPVWRHAKRPVVVSELASPRLARVRTGAAIEVLHDPRPARWRALLRALRPHQWAKNALIGVPLLTAHQFGSLGAWIAVVLAIASFSLAASSIYVLNDLMDLGADRRHSRKRRRPLAAGTLPLSWGFAAVPVLLAGAMALAWLLPPRFLVLLSAYLVLTTAYSLHLKKRIGLDVVVLACLYTLRVGAGAAAIDVPVSPWLLGFSVFLFTSLALEKRMSELLALPASSEGVTAGRGYRREDLAPVGALGAASAVTAVLVLALYITGPDVIRLYRHGERLWLLAPLMLYWLLRVWILAWRGAIDDDPVVFAVEDRISYLVLAAAVLVILAAI